MKFGWKNRPLGFNVPILSQYRFVVRKKTGNAENPKIRHVVAEQLISFRRSESTGKMQAMYLTFVPTVWYFDRNKNNVIESFYGKENNGNFSGYILYSSPGNLNLQIAEQYKDGQVTERATRSATSLSGFNLLFGQITGEDFFIKRSRFRTKSEEEDDEPIEGGELPGVDVFGDAPDEDEEEDEDDSGGSSGGYGGGGGSGWMGGGGTQGTTTPAMYASTSTLTSTQITLLNSAINSLANNNPFYKAIIQYINSKGIKIKFWIDPSLVNDDAYAKYEKSTKSIAFRSSGYITADKLREELIHAVQHNIYGSAFTNTVRSYEFEAKVFQDLACTMNDGVCPYIGSIGQDSQFETQYNKWIRDLNNYGNFATSDVAQFNNFCSRWNGYSGSTSSSFTPQTLLNFF